MGSAGQAHGLTLTTDGDAFLNDLELFRMLPGHRLHNQILAISFAKLSELPPEAKRELRKLNLPLAGPSAYPMLHVMGSRAGGLPRDRAERFLAVLEAFVDCFEQEGGPDELLAGEGWQTADGSVRFEMPQKQDPLGDWPGEVDRDHLRSGRTDGPGADWRACRPFLGELDDRAYDPKPYLVSFRRWLEKRFAESTVKKHLANAEHFFDFLTGWIGVRPEALHECDLRGFLYDWYPRKAAASETEAKSIHASLENLLTHLETEFELEFLWAPRVLRERETFRWRWRTIEPGPFWDSEVQAWRSLLTAHLETLAMLPRNSLGIGEFWGQTMGTSEADLYDELMRNWLHWRDDAIDRGVTAWDDLVPLLSDMQQEWETSPHEGSGGRTPYEVIVEERREQASKQAKSQES